MANQIHYDPEIIQSYAAKLYSRANTIVAMYTLFGATIGFAVAFAIVRVLSTSLLGAGGPGLMEMLIGVVPGALIGYFMGMERSFSLRLQAQTALCQVAIEANTRGHTQNDQSQNNQSWAQR